jgi:hypothetical protein
MAQGRGKFAELLCIRAESVVECARAPGISALRRHTLHEVSPKTAKIETPKSSEAKLPFFPPKTVAARCPWNSPSRLDIAQLLVPPRCL